MDDLVVHIVGRREGGGGGGKNGSIVRTYAVLGIGGGWRVNDWQYSTEL